MIENETMHTSGTVDRFADERDKLQSDMRELRTAVGLEKPT